MVAVQVWWSSLVAAERGLVALLDPIERARVESLERAADQGRSMVAAALLRVAVGERLGVPAADVVVDRTCAECGRPHGRPHVLGPGDVLPDVSVSHSGLLVVVALGDGVRVGVDVQRVADLDDPREAPDEHRAADEGEAADERRAADERHRDDAGRLTADERLTVDERARTWVEREAVLKLGTGRGRASVQGLATPLTGYVAALATVTEVPSGDLVVRHWPADASAAPGR